MSRDTIAFISTYEHPSRDSIERTVRAAFPEYRVENFRVGDIIRQHPEWRWPNVAATAREFGGELLRGAALREKYYRTTYLFRKLKAAMPSIIDPGRHVFSFQTQSIFDTSAPGVAHFIYTDHTHLSNLSSPYFDRRQLYSPAWRELERTVYHNATCVFTRSSNITADVINHYGVAADKVECVYSSSNVPIAADVRPDNQGYANRNILFVGKDWERKGGPEVVEAFRKVREVYPDARLTIIGASPSLNIPGCTVLGAVSLQDLTRHYAQASVFCLPTRLEPFGIVFVEAMMHRLPVVATRVGAVPDMVQEGRTGLLVEPGDADALAAALVELLGDPERCQRLGEAGYERAMANYTWERVGQRMRERILRLLPSPA